MNDKTPTQDTPRSVPPAFDIKDYRQPMVTSLGVILGFLIGFLAQWVSEDDFELAGMSDVLVFVGCILGAVILLRVLFRVLSPPDGNDPLTRYRGILRQYIMGVSIPFLCLITAAFF